MKPGEDEVRALVRQTLSRLLTDAPTQRVLVDAEFVAALPRGASVDLPGDAIITPLAMDLAREKAIELRPAKGASAAQPAGPAERAVAIAADHGGFALKQQLIPYLAELGYEPIDLGTHSSESVDYPDFALAVASAVAQRRCGAGIIIDGAGIGSAITANKVPGIRASLCYDVSTAVNAREHNHANVLTLGAGLIGAALARQIVKTWLETPWAGGRHANRVEKITAIEKRFSKG